MKIVWILLFILVYLSGLFLLYFDLPEKPLADEGEVYFYSCNEYDCAKIFLDLANISTDVKCAFYDLDEPRLVDYFENDDSGLLLYEENNDYDLGTSVKINGLMHHKFCVFDDELVLSGSWNPTERGTEKNDNYVFLVDSDVVASKFNEEFERVKNEEPVGSKGFEVEFENFEMSVCFSPGNNCEELIVEEILNANKSVDVLAFSFTSSRIAEALVNASLRGVDVTVVFEKTRVSSYSQHTYLNESGVDVYFDGNKYTMHEKMFIIDNSTAILGSYNPTKNANMNNDENLVVIRNGSFADRVLIEFERVLNQSFLI